MTSFFAIRCIALLCTALAVLPGCGVAASSAPATAPAATSATVKPGATLAVQVQGASAFASGASARLNLKFLHARPGARLVVSYRTEAGMALESAAQTTLTADAQGQAQDAPLLRATADGRHYLNVFVTQEGAQGQTQQAVSIPVSFGAVTLQKKAPLPSGGAQVVTPSGESLVILPASEPRK